MRCPVCHEESALRVEGTRSVVYVVEPDGKMTYDSAPNETNDLVECWKCGAVWNVVETTFSCIDEYLVMPKKEDADMSGSVAVFFEGRNER